MITKDRMIQFVPATNQDIVLCAAPRFEELRGRYGCITPTQVAHFMAQIAHESSGFTRLVEDLDYSAKRIPVVWKKLTERAEELAHNPMKLANAAYSGMNGNGNEVSGDGYRFRGRGFIQLTGRANYEKYGKIVGIDITDRPERAAWPEIGAEIALAYWRAVGANVLAANDDITNLTRAINGGLNGLAERTKLYEKAKEIFL